MENTFGERVRAERERLGWTQQKLADEAAGNSPDRRLTQDDIAKIENRKVIRSKHAPAIAAALGLRLVWALTGKGPKFDAGGQEHGASGLAGSTAPPEEASGLAGREPTIAGLLERLSVRLRAADPTVREEVARMVSRYLERPEQGAMYAKAIEALLGEKTGDASDT